MRLAQEARGRASAFVAALIVATSIGTAAVSADDGIQAIARSEADLIALADDHGALGVYFQEDDSAVVVMPLGGAAEFPMARAVTIGMPVKVETAPITVETVASITDDLHALRKAISHDISYAFYFDLRNAAMVVQTDGPANAFAAISSKYGTDVKIVSKATGGQTSGRQADTSPFWGGARLNASGSCTSGFVAKSSTTTYMSTAGHCWTVGTNITSGGGSAEGSVALRDYPKYEAEFYAGKTYSAQIYSGVQGDNTSHLPILGRRIASVGVGQTGYCRTGYNSGRYCNWKVTSLNASFCANLLTCTDGLYAFEGTASVGGDSGGPIYKTYNSGALIVGTIVGYFSSPLGTTNYGEKMGTVMQRWNLTQVCSGTCVVQ
jgi:hypothetical protein